jgi:DNA-binding MarR family transcriptional regulator
MGLNSKGVKEMPGAGERRVRAGGTRNAKALGENYAHLVRYSHIFSSVVRDVLELELLREITPLPLSVSQFRLLKLMTFDGLDQLGEVAGFLGVSPPAATRTIDKLERLGLVSRSPSKGDRRATLLSVTTAGRRLVRRYEELKIARLSPVLEGFGSQDLKKFVGLLERFSVSLVKANQVGGFCMRCAACIDGDCAIGRVRGGCPYLQIRAAHEAQGRRDAMS